MSSNILYKPQILVVEDNPETSQLFKVVLGRRYKVILAMSPDEALAAVDAHQFDLILMDIGLKSDKNGIDVLNIVRKKTGYQITPVVAVTAYALPGDRKRFLDSGFIECLNKPFDLAELRELVDRQLELVL